VALLSAWAVSLASAQTVLIDFASDATFRGKTSPGNWNSVGFGYVGNLIDSTGVATTIDFAPDGIGDTDSFNGPGGGASYTGWNFGGDPVQQQTAIDANRDTTEATIDNAALGDLGVAEAAMDFFSATQGRFQIQQVTQGQAYDLTFFSSRRYPTNDTSTTFSVFDDSAYSNLLASITLNHGSGNIPNVADTATLSGLVGPSNINNIFYIQYEGDAAGTGYINSMSISVVPEPSTYALLAGLLALTSIAVRRRRD
jgi:hypothetical protein